LEAKVKEKMGVEYEEAMMGLMMTPSEYDAYCLHEALNGLGLSDPVLVGIICTRDAKVITRFLFPLYGGIWAEE
jgi:annexin A7/11